jgi:hypothetical protein
VSGIAGVWDLATRSPAPVLSEQVDAMAAALEDRVRMTPVGGSTRARASHLGLGGL